MITVSEFKILLQKNLDELIWRDRGWGPIPIHGKGEKGFSKEVRIMHNQSKINQLKTQSAKFDVTMTGLVGEYNKAKPTEKAKITNKMKEVENAKNAIDKQIIRREDAIQKTYVSQKIVPFQTEQDAHNWGMKYHETISGKFTETEVTALKSYKGTEYRNINDKLRGKDINSNTDEKITQIASSLEKSKLPQKVIVHRGISLNEPLSSEGEIAKKQYQHMRSLFDNPDKAVGTIISDAAFTSTSLFKPFANSWGSNILLNISVPKGSKALYLDGISNRQEFELLLSHGSKFQITKVTKLSTNKLEIDAKLK